MRQKSFIKRDASGKLYVEQPPPRTLTPQEILERDRIAKEIDEGIREAFKDGLDLSNYNSR